MWVVPNYDDILLCLRNVIVILKLFSRGIDDISRGSVKDDDLSCEKNVIVFSLYLKSIFNQSSLRGLHLATSFYGPCHVNVTRAGAQAGLNITCEDFHFGYAHEKSDDIFVRIIIVIIIN